MKTCFVVILCGLLGAVVSTARGQDHPPAPVFIPTEGISLAISAINGVVKTGSYVQLKVTLENKSDHDFVIFLSKAGATCTYKVDVRDEAGGLAPDTRTGILTNGHVDQKEWEHLGLTPEEIMETCASSFPFKLKAGAVIDQTLMVSALYNVTKRGKYNIQITKEPDQGGIVVRSNAVTVIVTP
jgi:hypothetical protein